MFTVARSGFAALVNAVWTLGTLASRTVTASSVTDKTGYSVSTVADKAGYSLTAGSYSSRASSTQRGVSFIDNNAGTQTTAGTTISAVTTTRSHVSGTGSSTTGDLQTDGLLYMKLDGSTVMNGYRGSNTINAESRGGWDLIEIF